MADARLLANPASWGRVADPSLGGETIIGHDSVIGSNVFITHPIAPGTRVSIKSQELLYKNGQGYVIQPDVPGEETDWFYII